MTDSAKNKQKKKHDVLLFIGVLLLGCLLLLFFSKSPSGTTVTATVDGHYVGSWPLSEQREIRIDGIGGSNLLRIENGTAHVIDADCPDRICVHHIPVSHAGERIVCLPHRVILSIETTKTSKAPDAISQ